MELSGIDLRKDDWLMVEIAVKLVKLERADSVALDRRGQGVDSRSGPRHTIRSAGCKPSPEPSCHLRLARLGFRTVEHDRTRQDTRTHRGGGRPDGDDRRPYG